MFLQIEYAGGRIVFIESNCVSLGGGGDKTTNML